MLRTTLLGLGAAMAMAISFVSPATAQYPDRPLTLIVPWGAGGGTDGTARIIASGLQRELGQPVNVINRTGGSGVVGHSAIAEAEPDGYTIGLVTPHISMMHWQGLTTLTAADYRALALVNEDAGAIQVAADAPYETMTELLAAIASEPPGTFQASGDGQGGIWHLGLAGMLKDRGIDPTKVSWVPSEGAAPALQDLVAGGIRIVPCSLVEARALIEAGRVKSLAVMGTERSNLFEDVPTLQEETGSEWKIGAWRGIVAPAGIPEDVAARLMGALEKVYQSDEYRNFMQSRGYGLRWASGEEFASFMKQSDEAFGQIMRAVGLAK